MMALDQSSGMSGVLATRQLLSIIGERRCGESTAISLAPARS
jgi:hypothetical protein